MNERKLSFWQQVRDFIAGCTPQQMAVPLVRSLKQIAATMREGKDVEAKYREYVAERDAMQKQEQ